MVKRTVTSVAAALLALAAVSTADIINLEFAEWSARGSDDDLFRFVTRPDLTPPKLNVPLNKKDKTAPGYLFVAPYDCLQCSRVPTTSYVTQQIGPHIYTQDGELVWSGNEIFPDKKVFDFKSVTINDEYYLALVSPEDADHRPFPDGVAMILNSSYQPVFSLGTEELGERIDMHEFNILDNGKTALIGMKKFRKPTEAENAMWNGTEFKGEIMDCIFTEMDLSTQERVFNWTASEHISLAETSNPPPEKDDIEPFWDWLHMNSIDKDIYDNYLVSGRATNTIYYISPAGAILWRLGGLSSDFEQNFNFSRQHHARVRRQSPKNMVISFFDNAADDSGKWQPTSESSGINIVDLDFEQKTASLLYRMARPDGGLSEAKGNVEYLSNGAVFGGWGENAFMSEYVNPGGEKVYEASFATRRFANYRAYKMPFVAQPTTKPVTKAFVTTNSRGHLRTSIYASWNGATEIARWRFHSRAVSNGIEKVALIGEAARTGFETLYVAAGYHPILFAEALDLSGNSLANSSLEVTDIPAGFHNAENPMRPSNSRQVSGGWMVRTVLAFLAGIAATILWEQSRSIKRNVTLAKLRHARVRPALKRHVT